MLWMVLLIIMMMELLIINQRINKVISTGSVFAVFRNSRGERKFEDVFWSEEVYDEFMPIFDAKGWELCRER